MMNSQKNAMECAVSMASESEFLKAMDAKKQGNEPLASEELAELLRRTEQLADRLAPERAAALRTLCDGWQRLVQAGYALALDYVPRSGDGVGELLTTAPEGADWRADNLRLTQAAEQLAAAAPEVLPLCDRWDDLCVLALVLGLRR